MKRYVFAAFAALLMLASCKAGITSGTILDLDVANARFTCEDANVIVKDGSCAGSDFTKIILENNGNVALSGFGVLSGDAIVEVNRTIISGQMVSQEIPQRANTTLIIIPKIKINSKEYYCRSENTTFELKSC